MQPGLSDSWSPQKYVKVNVRYGRCIVRSIVNRQVRHWLQVCGVSAHSCKHFLFFVEAPRLAIWVAKRTMTEQWIAQRSGRVIWYYCRVGPGSRDSLTSKMTNNWAHCYALSEAVRWTCQLVTWVTTKDSGLLQCPVLLLSFSLFTKRSKLVQQQVIYMY